MILSLPALYSSVMPTVTSYLSPAGDAAVPREKPSALRPGDTIGIVAPGTHGGMTDYNQAIHFLEEMGYKVKLAPRLLPITAISRGATKSELQISITSSKTTP